MNISNFCSDCTAYSLNEILINLWPSEFIHKFAPYIAVLGNERHRSGLPGRGYTVITHRIVILSCLYFKIKMSVGRGCASPAPKTFSQSNF